MNETRHFFEILHADETRLHKGETHKRIVIPCLTACNRVSLRVVAFHRVSPCFTVSHPRVAASHLRVAVSHPRVAAYHLLDLASHRVNVTYTSQPP